MNNSPRWLPRLLVILSWITVQPVILYRPPS